MIIDDYVPVNDELQPLFAQPVDNTIWMMLVEKARAKLYGSYQKMFKKGGDPKGCLQELTFAPTEVIRNVNK